MNLATAKLSRVRMEAKGEKFCPRGSKQKMRCTLKEINLARLCNLT
ncbi:hypothetical protein H6G42_13330 [Synechocystis sp. FACHB-929]|nr:hypothetical protein [Synechocystis sp. FACHB-898]MBD2661912.1 hypothetical protein [Synechocystis sp. FACHB-929]